MPNDSLGLKFIAGKYEGGLFPLNEGKETVIGRGGELDITLVEDMVSRKHAKIAVEADKIVIQDLGSTNGTFVNGEKIRRARLKEGDRVLIGTSIMRVVSTADMPDKQGGMPLRAPNPVDTEGPANMSGSLAELGVPDLLQLFSTNKRSGELHLENKTNKGRIFFREGKIYYAIWKDLDSNPRKALFRMAGWTDGKFSFGPLSDEEFILELEEPTDQLIQEITKQLDEFSELQKDLPKLRGPIKLMKPLEPSLADLDKDELDVLQLTHNLPFFQSVLDESYFSDLKTAKIVRKLIKSGYVKA